MILYVQKRWCQVGSLNVCRKVIQNQSVNYSIDFGDHHMHRFRVSYYDCMECSAFKSSDI